MNNNQNINQNVYQESQYDQMNQQQVHQSQNIVQNGQMTSNPNIDMGIDLNIHNGISHDIITNNNDINNNFNINNIDTNNIPNLDDPNLNQNFISDSNVLFNNGANPLANTLVQNNMQANLHKMLPNVNQSNMAPPNQTSTDKFSTYNNVENTVDVSNNSSNNNMNIMSQNEFNQTIQQPEVEQSQLQMDSFPTEKTFKFANDCAISVGNTPSGFSTILIYIKDTPFFGIGTLFSLTALEIVNAEIYYNSKKDFLLDEDIDPNSNLPVDVDKDRRVHKISIYKTEENEYRIDLCKLSKTGIPEIDAQDPWKDFSDIKDSGAGKQIDMIKRFTEKLKVSRNEPDMIILGKVPDKYPELEQTVGVVMFKRVQ